MTNKTDLEYASGLWWTQMNGLQLGNNTAGVTQYSLDSHDDAISSSNFVNIWAKGGVYAWTAPGAEETISIVSTSAADDKDGGAGARSILLEGLDANFLPQTEIVQLEGLTPAVSSKSYLRLNKATVISVGTYGAGATGNIEGTGSSSAKTWFYINATEAKSELGFYSIPANKRAILFSYTISSGSNQQIEIIYQVRPNALTATSGFVQTSHLYLNDQTLATRTPGQTIEGPADIQALAKSATGNGKMGMQATFLLTPKAES